MNPDSTTAATLLMPLTQLLHRFFHGLDERRYPEMLDSFTDDCRWLRQGQWLLGKPAVQAALASRPAHTATRHVLTNAWLGPCDAHSAVLEAYMTAYRYPAPGPTDDGALPCIAGPWRFNLISTMFRRDAGHDWRIAEQRMVPAFAFPQ